MYDLVILHDMGTTALTCDSIDDCKKEWKKEREENEVDGIDEVQICMEGTGIIVELLYKY